MASTKKRKSELDSDNIPNAYNAGDVKQHYTVEYTRQLEDDSGDGAASGSDSDYVEEDDVRKLLEPLDSDQLISLLASAAARDGVTLAEIRALADVDPAHRKLFVHSLGWETTTDSLRAAFDRYGEIDDIRVVLDRLTGRSKGYGFILFRHRSSAQRALRHPHKLIDNRMTTCQLASVGPTQNPNSHTSSNHIPNSKPNPNPVDNLPRKIYVGNVHPDIDGRRLYAFFSQYGEIEEGPIGFDRQTGKPKGFALFVYRTIEGARKVLEEPNKNFEGHELICQRATDSSKGRASAIASNKVGGGSAVDPPNAVTNVGGFIASGYGGQVTPSDVGLAQQGTMFSPGILGQGMQLNAAVLAMLAAAGQNPAAFGVNPAMLATLNPAFAGAFGAGVSQSSVSQAAMAQQGALPLQGYLMGGSGFQNVGFQGSPGFQGPPGFQGTSVSTQGVGGTVTPYQVSGAMQRSNMGPISGFGSQ